MQSSLRFIDLIEEFAPSSVDGGLEVDGLFVLIHADRPADQIREYVERRFTARLTRALKKLQSARPPAAELDPEHPWNFIQNELERLESAWENGHSREIGGASESALLLDAVNDEFDAQVAELEQLSIAFHDLVEDRLRFADPDILDAWTDCYNLICRGADDQGAERKEAWNEARQVLRDPIEHGAQKVDSVARMTYAWLIWASTAKHSEAANRMRDLFGTSQSLPPTIRGLLFRLLSRTLCLDSRFHEAALVANSFLNASPEQALEALTIFTDAQQHDKALEKLESVLKVRPLFGIVVLSHENLSALHEPTIQALADETARLRVRAQHQLTEWDNSVQRVREAERVSNVSLSVPAILTKGPSELESVVAESGPFLSGAIEDLARSRSQELSQVALAGFDRELRLRQEAVTRARASLQTMQTEREEQLQKAAGIEMRARMQAREDEQQLQHDLSGLQRTFTWCAASAAVCFFGYILLAAVLGSMKFQIGPETSIGKLMLSLTAIPILMATATQITSTLRTTAARNESEVKIKKAAKESLAQQELVKQRFEGRAPKLRDDLEKAEAAANQMEAAMQQVRGVIESPLALENAA